MPRNRSKKVLPRQRKVGFSSYAADPYHHYQGGDRDDPAAGLLVNFARAEHRAHPVLDPAEVKSRD